MPEIADGTQTDKMQRVNQALAHALKDIFTTMFGTGIEIVSHELVPDLPHISSMIGFGGELSGFVALHFSQDMACRIGAGFLGMPMDRLDETVRDTLAELVNMVAGGLRNQLSSDHEMFKLSLPSVVEGLEYSTRGPAGSLELMLGVVAKDYRFKLQLVMERKKPG
jgi:CheY-specific phosphatase CheX